MNLFSQTVGDHYQHVTLQDSVGFYLSIHPKFHFSTHQAQVDWENWENWENWKDPNACGAFQMPTETHPTNALTAAQFAPGGRRTGGGGPW